MWKLFPVVCLLLPACAPRPSATVVILGVTVVDVRDGSLHSDQTVLIANLYRQDTRWKGYTTQFSFHYNNDRPSRHFDENDFLVRPALIGHRFPEAPIRPLEADG